MKETNNPLNGKDYGFTKPWNTPVDITKENATEEIKRLGSESQSIRFNEDLAEMSNEEFAQYCFEIRCLLYEEEIRRFGETK